VIAQFQTQSNMPANKLVGTILALTIASLVASAANDSSSRTKRVITADLKEIKGPRSMVWQDCVGAGRVAEGLRDGWPGATA